MRLSRSAVVVLLAVISAACSSFDSDAEPGASDGGASDGGATLDGALADGAAPDTGGATDAGAPEAGACTTAPVTAISESFTVPDGGLWDASFWDTTRVNGLFVDSADSVSPPSSLRVDIEASPALRWLERPLGHPCHVRATTKIRVSSAGSGDLDLFGVDNGAPPTGLGIILVRVGSGFAIESPSGSSFTQKNVTATFTEWTEVIIDVDLEASRWSARVGGQNLSGNLPASWPGNEGLFLRLGLFYANQVVSPWVVRFDDVTLVP